MGKGRLEAFSDAVIAIIMTIMVLELKVPHESDLAALRPLIPVFLSYLLSFIFIGIYWNNHHHLLQASRHVNGRVLWANLHWLFWLSLIPFVTSWMGESHFAKFSVALYGTVMLFAGLAYFILGQSLIYHNGKDSLLAIAVAGTMKGKVTLVLQAIAVPFAFVNTWFACTLFIIVAVMWLIPDRRIEKIFSQ